MEENRLYEPPEEGFSLCVRVRERLQDYAEGLLDAMMAEAIRAHLSVCYLCAKEYNELEQTIHLVETLPFVELEKDFAPAIMAALKTQSGHSFQAPVVEMETEAIIRVSLPRTTTGRQRPLSWSAPGSEADIRPWERVMTAIGLGALLLLLFWTPWARTVLASGGAMAVGWLQRAAEAVGAVPVIGAMLHGLTGLLGSVGESAQRFQQAAMGVSPAVWLVDFGLFALVFYALWLRRVRRTYRL